MANISFIIDNWIAGGNQLHDKRDVSDGTPFSLLEYAKNVNGPRLAARLISLILLLLGFHYRTRVFLIRPLAEYQL